MILGNARIFLGESGFISGGIEVQDGVIRRIFTGPFEEGEDLQGKMLVPGLIDIHIHGCAGCDFSDGDPEGLLKMARYLAQNGITSFMPASMSLPYEQLARAFRTAAEYKEKEPGDVSRLIGIHMEGPFFSEKKKGAQNAAYLKTPDIEAFRKLYRESGGSIRIVDVAPELEGAEAFIREVSGYVKVSVGHTAAVYGQAKAAFEAGASHVTHLYNGMNDLYHREPGVIGAAAERDDVFVELICDGLHNHESVIRLTFKLFAGRICLISDAVRICGTPESSYELGGQLVTYRDGAGRLPDGTIAGAAKNLMDDVKTAVGFGIPLKDALLSATLNPAKEAGIDFFTGSLAPGKAADMIVLSEDLEPERVYISGKRIR